MRNHAASGQSLVDYALIAGLIFLVSVVSVNALGPNIVHGVETSMGGMLVGSSVPKF